MTFGRSVPYTLPVAKDKDGLSPRERKFVELRRADPVAAGWKIAKAAGFKGSEKGLKLTAARLLKRALVSRAIFAPRSRAEAKEKRDIGDMTDAEIGAAIKQVWLDIMRAGGVTPADKIRAATKLGETIRGLFVPIQIDSKQIITLEDMVRAMGGAPPDERQDVAEATQRGAEA